LLGPFYTWQPEDTIQWFEDHGVPLKTEKDGRMFPTTDRSQTIIDCLLSAARDAAVQIETQTELKKIQLLPETHQFKLLLSKQSPVVVDRLILATGGGQASGGVRMAQAMGHQIETLAPSLFTFNITDPRIEDLQGLSVAHARVRCSAIDLEPEGPVLITHWGMSGPGILKLSAWAARELAKCNYEFTLQVNWVAGISPEEVNGKILSNKQKSGRQKILNSSPFSIPKRLWERLLLASEIPPERQWAQLSKKEVQSLSDALTQSEFQVTGKSTNKDEFVTCGGVSLKEVDLRTLESKKVPGLYFAGEVLDIDGITGGFNFQAAWTTGYLAGVHAGQSA